VLRLCKGLGFKTQEMPLERPVHLSSRVQLTTGPNDLIDSWLAIQCDNNLILNLNDCVFSDVELEELRGKVGKPMLLLTQFSYANWVGNPGDWHAHRRHAAHKRDQIRRQIEILQPLNLIPFASYVVFAHEENFDFNKEANQVSDIHRFTTEELKVPTVVLYPGDRWEIGTPHDSSNAIRQYQLDYEAAIHRGPAHRKTPVSLAQLRSAQESYFRKMHAKHRRLVLACIPSSTAYIRDLEVSVRLSFREGLTVSEILPGQTDIALSADSLRYCYLYDWGGDTLAVNGRYEVPQGGHPDRFFWNFRPGMYSATGRRLGFRFLLSQIVKRGRQAISKRGTE
jgi:UDP-MurNAc hydroxylase